VVLPQRRETEVLEVISRIAEPIPREAALAHEFNDTCDESNACERESRRKREIS